MQKYLEDRWSGFRCIPRTNIPKFLPLNDNQKQTIPRTNNPKFLPLNDNENTTI